MSDVKKDKIAKKSNYKDELKGFAIAAILAITMRTFAFDPYNIPSSSMKPSLLIGDFLFVSKFSYGYTHYSLPFSPNIFSGRIFASDPKRGDVVVFRPSFRPHEDWIKRVIGLPGDTIQLKDGVLFINGESCPLEETEDFVDHLELEGEMREENRVFDEEGKKIKQFIQTLPNGVKHHIIKKLPFGEGMADNTQEFIVPAESIFVMGDNRDGSHDSRFSAVGFIPYENLIGKAQILFFSTTARWWEIWQWPTGMRINRLFHLIR